MYQPEKPTKYMEALAELKVQCKCCGHKVVMPIYRDSLLCSHCNNKVLNTGVEHFKYKLKKLQEKEAK